MATTLLQSVEHDLDHLALYVRDAAGILVDAFKVEFQVFDESDGLPGELSLPVADRTDVTDDDVGHFTTGCYGVVDGAAAWTPPNVITRGRVDWYYTLVEGDAEVLVQRFFEVLPNTAVRRASLGLALIQDLRDAGVAAAVADQTLHELLLRIRDLVHTYCRQRFIPVRETKMLSGSGTHLLHLSEPLFGLGSHFQDTTELTVTTLRNSSIGDNRRNPKIEVVTESSSVFSGISTSRFSERLPQYITGVWGFLEPDTLAAPEEVKQAAIRLAVLVYGERASGSGGVAGGRIRRQRTDRNEIEYDVSTRALPGGLNAVMRDRVVLEALRMYRAAPIVAVIA